MKIKMLESVAGRDFSLSPGDETDRFTDKEAGRMIKAGIAEKAPPPVVKKPATKAEWDAERDELVAENEALHAKAEEAAEREQFLLKQVESLSAFRASVVGALDLDIAAAETTEQAKAPETRG